MVETVEKVEIDEGWMITIRTIPIIPGVEVKVYDEESAEIVVRGHSLPFGWNEETRQLVEEIDTFESIELLSLLAANTTD